MFHIVRLLLDQIPHVSRKFCQYRLPHQRTSNSRVWRCEFVEFARDDIFAFVFVWPRVPPVRPPGFTSSGCMLSIVGQEQKLVRKDITYRRGVGHADPCTSFLLICALLHASSLHETIEGSSCSIIVLSFFFFFSIILPWFDLDLNFKDGEIRDCHRRRRYSYRSKEKNVYVKIISQLLHGTRS